MDKVNQQMLEALKEIVMVFSPSDGRVWTVSSKSRAIEKAKKAIDAADKK